MALPPPFMRPPDRTIPLDGGVVHVFNKRGNSNDQALLEGFGQEWAKFGSLSEADLHAAGAELFDMLPAGALPAAPRMLDVGCGNGRWSRYLQGRMGHIDAIDPSTSVLGAAAFDTSARTIRWSMARAEDLPFPEEAFDLVLCIGVLHHVQDPAAAMREALRVLRSEGTYYFYLYYALDHRGSLYRALHGLSDRVRRVVHRLPGPPKRGVCELIALLVYLPLVSIVRLTKAMGIEVWRYLPLAYYHNKSFRVMRNDALDRFGTGYEQRYSKAQIEALLTAAGFDRVAFSNGPPYWHGVACKPSTAQA